MFAWSALRGARPAPAPASVSPEPELWPGLVEGWNELPPPPASRPGDVVIWTGRELILWGGGGGDGAPHFNDGYVLDAATLAWRPMAPSPLSPRSWAAAVWTGEEIVIWGGADGTWPGEGHLGDGAAYDPSTDSWRTISTAPLRANAPIVVGWTGREMLVWGSYRQAGEGTGAAYDPSADSWRTIPDSPILLNDVRAAWTGREVLAFGANLRVGNDSDTRFAVGAAYDPGSDTWRELARSELSPQASDVAWDGTEMVAVDYLLGVAGYDPGRDDWRPLPRLPVNACEGYPEIAPVAGLIIAAFCGELATLEPGAERWHVLEGRGPGGYFGDAVVHGELVGTGDLLLLLGSFPPGTEGYLRAYVPPTDVPSGPTPDDAWDVAAAFAALRSHYPYDFGVPEQVLREIGTFVSPEGLEAWESGDRGLRALWDYYPGFAILSVEGPLGTDGDIRFEVVASFHLYSGDGMYEETLVLAPGLGLDGEPHDLVVVDARAGG